LRKNNCLRNQWNNFDFQKEKKFFLLQFLIESYQSSLHLPLKLNAQVDIRCTMHSRLRIDGPHSWTTTATAAMAL